MLDLSKTIVAKSDQLNADDLIGCTKIIKITKVSLTDTDQPVVINYEGDEGKPYKPCKGMRRGMVKAWGRDGEKYIGRSMYLFCNDSVKWAGEEVGGIQISHMSHIDKKIVFSLAINRKSKRPYTILPLVASDEKKVKATESDIKGWCDAMTACKTQKELSGIGRSIKEKGYDKESSDMLGGHYQACMDKIRIEEEKK